MTKQEEIGYITQHWRGQLSLAQSYWVNGVVIGFIYDVFCYLILSAAASSPRGFILLIFLIPPTVIVTWWQFVGIWRSATRHIQKTKRKFWAIVAKVMSVISVIFTALFLFQAIAILPYLIKNS